MLDQRRTPSSSLSAGAACGREALPVIKPQRSGRGRGRGWILSRARMVFCAASVRCCEVQRDGNPPRAPGVLAAIGRSHRRSAIRNGDQPVGCWIEWRHEPARAPPASTAQHRAAASRGSAFAGRYGASVSQREDIALAVSEALSNAVDRSPGVRVHMTFAIG